MRIPLLRGELWFISYGLLGLTQNGLLPVLMPLAAPHGGAAGLTYAAFSLLGVVAPFLGSWADRTGRHRDLLIWGLVSSGILLFVFGFAPDSLRILLAAGAGLGAMATTTAGNVLAIQGQPEAAWDARVALLQRYISAGQVIGLIAAGLLARTHPSAGFAAAGSALLMAGALALASAPKGAPRASAAKPAPRPMVGGDAGVSGPHHRGHHLSLPQLGAYLRVINWPLRHFLIVWMIAYPAMNGFATLFPAAMIRQFGMNPIWPSCAYAVGVAASLLLYGLAGAATHRFGGGRMLTLGLGLRLLLLGVIAVDSFWHFGPIGWLALTAFALIQFVWPLLAVGANSLSVRLAPTAQGESVGLFNAATSLAAALGSALAGPIFDGAGFFGLGAAAFIAVGSALIPTMIWLKGWETAARI
jgi:MFS family permease